MDNIIISLNERRFSKKKYWLHHSLYLLKISENKSNVVDGCELYFLINLVICSNS